MSKKRGQITVFIILGIVILLIIGLFFWLRSSTTVFNPEEVLPEQVVPIRDFIKTCVDSLGKDALDRIGSTGGYINVPKEIKSDPSGYIKLSPIENNINPYWFHNSELRVPTEEFIANEINTYIESNLRSCIVNLEAFRNQYNILEIGNLSVNTVFSYEDTIINVEYPLEISDKMGKKISEIKKITLNLPIRFKAVYETAKEIMEKENKDMKIEQIAMDLVAIDPDLPYIGADFSCKRKTWKIPAVASKIKQLLRYNIPEIRIAKSTYIPVPAENEYVKNHYVWDATSSKFKDMHVGFSFDEKWPFYIYIRPNQGNILESGMQKGVDYASWLCMQTWKFTYDMRFPILTTVKDERSAYAFSFSFPVLIDHNQGVRNVAGTASFDFSRVVDSEEYCGRKPVSATILSYENISTDYGEEHEEISGVNLSYVCLKYACPIGQTKWVSGGAVASYKGNFPYCAQGILRGIKEGYKEGISVIDTEVSGKEHKLYLTPAKSIIKYSVMKHPYDDPAKYEFLSSDEEASITLQKSSHKSYGAYPIAEDMPIEFLAKGDNTYKLTIYLADSATIKGGYIANWAIPWEKLKNSDEIVFHVVYKQSFKDEDDEFGFWTELEKYSKKVPEPELRKRK